jgi:hypothetical protein
MLAGWLADPTPLDNIACLPWEPRACRWLAQLMTAAGGGR